MADVDIEELTDEEIDAQIEAEIEAEEEAALEGIEIEDEVEIDEMPQDGLQYCKGFFAWYPAEEFTAKEDYCDDYLRSKGLLVETDEGE